MKPHLRQMWCIPPKADCQFVAAMEDVLEIHHTPKHGSWLDMAEIELSVLSRQCLDRRIEDKPTLTREVAAWESDRNAKATKADWRFTGADARIKLRKLYPTIDG